MLLFGTSKSLLTRAVLVCQTRESGLKKERERELLEKKSYNKAEEVKSNCNSQ